MKQQLPAGMPETLDYPACTVGDLLTGAARHHPGVTALRDGEQSLSYAELHELALRCAQGLRERGITPGDAVALHQPNSLWFTVSYYGVLLAGAVVTPVNPSLPPLALREQLAEAGAVAVIGHPSTTDALDTAAPPEVRLTVLVPPTHAAPAPAAGGRHPSAVRLEELLAARPEPATPVEPADLAHLSFTGGTTGRSKAVRVRHRHVVANTVQVGCWRMAARPVVDEARPGETPAGRGLRLEHIPEAMTPYTARIGAGRGIAVAPLFHAMGLISQNVSTAGAGTAIMSGRFDPARYLADARRHRVTSVGGSPALFHALLAAPELRTADLSSVRVVSSGAAPIDTTTLGRLREVFSNACVVEGYGLTEATMALTTHLLEREGGGPAGSVGAPLFDTEIEIRDATGAGPLRTGEVGEVWARGPQIADGYLGRPDLTAGQFQDGWLRTGDLGRFDEEGWLFLVGRAKDMLIYKGYNVYPGPLEDHLQQHPAVAVAAVVGAPHPEAGEIPVAYVVPRGGAEPGPELARELTDFVAERVAAYQRIREVHFLRELPVSAAGKVLKSQLRGLRPTSEPAGGTGG